MDSTQVAVTSISAMLIAIAAFVAILVMKVIALREERIDVMKDVRDKLAQQCELERVLTAKRWELDALDRRIRQRKEELGILENAKPMPEWARLRR